MEPRHKPATRNTRSSVNQISAGKDPATPSLHLPHIGEPIKDGEITLGMLRPIGCVATACDADSTLAMLVRRKSETLVQLLTRLDLAIAKAYEEGIFTDEINPPPTNAQHP